MKKTAFLYGLFVIPSISFSQKKITKNIFAKDNSYSRIIATINDASWLTGTWQGEALSGSCSEEWSRAMAKDMYGIFRFIKKEQTQFCEFMSLNEENGSLTLRIKHFTKDLKGWEHKDSSVKCELLKKTPDALYFTGQTYKKINENTLAIYVYLGKPGELREEIFLFKRQDEK